MHMQGGRKVPFDRPFAEDLVAEQQMQIHKSAMYSACTVMVMLRSGLVLKRYRMHQNAGDMLTNMRVCVKRLLYACHSWLCQELRA